MLFGKHAKKKVYTKFGMAGDSRETEQSITMISVTFSLKSMTNYYKLYYVNFNDQGLENNFLEHWPREPPASKILWLFSISGRPLRNNIIHLYQPEILVWYSTIA